jgi:hypothetical protein
MGEQPTVTSNGMPFLVVGTDRTSGSPLLRRSIFLPREKNECGAGMRSWVCTDRTAPRATMMLLPVPGQNNDDDAAVRGVVYEELDALRLRSLARSLGNGKAWP